MIVVPVITGVGLLTPLGSDVEETWSALLGGQFITDHSRAKGFASGGGERIFDLATAAAHEATSHAAWRRRGGAAAPGRTALVVGTSKGPVEAFFTPPPSTSDKPSGLPNSHPATRGLAALAAHVRRSTGFADGPTLTLSAACASGLHALIRGAMMIRSREVDRVLVVAAEASVHPLFLGSFQRLGVLPREGHGCRPYDEARGGFLMSEAAAAVCLEAAEPAAGSSPPQVIARVDGYAFGGDATHLTGQDPAGGVLRHLLYKVVGARPLDLIHGHGTGTPTNDPVELAAFDDVCATPGDAPPVVYSHKGALGHSLGAAGLVSVVLSAVMHERGLVPPNVQTRSPLPTQHVRIARHAVATPVRRSIAVAAGFGGATAVISLVSP